MELDYFQLFTKNTVPQNKIVYIFSLHKNEEQILKKDIDMAVFIGTPDEALLKHCQCALELPVDASAADISNVIGQTFNYYAQWDQKLNEIVLRQGTPKELLDVSAPIFGNPIGIHNSALQCVAETDYSDSKREVASMQRRNRVNYIKNFLESPEFQEGFQRKEAFFTDSSSTNGCSLIQNIFIDDKFMYRVVITEREKKLNPQTMVLMEHLVGYLHVLLAMTGLWPEGDHTVLGQYIYHILDGSVQNMRGVSKQLDSRGWQNNDYYACFILKVGGIDVLDYTEQAISRHLGSLIPSAEIVNYNKQIVAVANLGSTYQDPSEIAHMYTEYMRDMGMKSGISNAVQGFWNIRFLYQQAEIALRIGQSLWNQFWLYRFSSVAPYYVMEQCTQALPLPAICAPEILEILKHDEANSTEYFRTLKEYLDCNMNLAESSRHLFIHRTTLLYRLEKLQKNFKIDLSFPLQRVYYHLSIQLICHTAYRSEDK